MGKVVLECNNLYKKFGKKEIIKNVSTTLESGDILGFIGPNGAGKTTTIKLILGLQKIDKGTVKINGFDVEKNFEKAIEKVGAIVENPDLYMYLSGYKNLELIARLYKNVDKARIDEVVRLVGLQERIHDKVSKYSLGMRQRLGIAQAILHRPNILILDEPTNGLDPEGIKDLRVLMQKLAKQEQMAILISSHNLAELDNFCTKICIIQNGEVIETKDIKELKEEENAKYTIFKVSSTAKIKELLPKAQILHQTKILNKAENLKQTENSKQTENLNKSEKLNKYEFKILVQESEIPNIVKKLVENNIEIYRIAEETVTLEDAFLKKTGGNKID